jgi:predicted RNase H-like nuclease (RuvC/YqgF family)
LKHRERKIWKRLKRRERNDLEKAEAHRRNLELKVDAQQREIEMLKMNGRRLEKRVTELNNHNDELDEKNQNLTVTIAHLDAQLKDNIESIKRVHVFNLLCNLYSSAFQSSPWH